MSAKLEKVNSFFTFWVMFAV